MFRVLFNINLDMNSEQYKSNTASKEAIILINAVILLYGVQFSYAIYSVADIPFGVILLIAPIVCLMGIFNTNKSLINMGVIFSVVAGLYSIGLCIRELTKYRKFYSKLCGVTFFLILMGLNIISIIFCTVMHPTAVPQGLASLVQNRRVETPSMGNTTKPIEEAKPSIDAPLLKKE